MTFENLYELPKIFVSSELLIKLTDAIQFTTIFQQSIDICALLEGYSPTDSFTHMIFDGIQNSSQQNVIFTKCPIPNVSIF